MSDFNLPRKLDAEHLSAHPMRARSTLPDQRRSEDDAHGFTASASCWRCGVPFARTTDEALRRCAELARAAS